MPQKDIESLRSRWELERSPQLALQLAEEYRRAGQPERALEVLREDLSAHPNHTSSRVALGRYLLDGGHAGEAGEVLEDVVADDPTHLVANKLLVRTYTQLGDRRRAVDRLDLYALLNESDPDIDELRLAIEGEAAPPTGPPPPADVPAAAQIREPDSPAAEPFPGLWDGLDVERWRAAIAAEGLFAVADRIAPAAARPEVGPAPVSETEHEPGPEPLAEAAATATLGELYLEQGHRGEAERIFRTVLEREPENEAARRGLERVGAAATGGLTAADLLRERGLEESADARERRRVLLESYLERIRAGGR